MVRWWSIEVRGWLRFLVGRRPAVTVLRVVVFLALYFGVFRQVYQPIRVTGVSMEPTYRDGRIKLLNVRAYRGGVLPERFDVVAVRKRETLRVLLKRVLGLPGEVVEVVGGAVYIGGERVEEPYVQGRGISGTRRPVRLGAGEYFIIGDNREVTAYGVVTLDEILGRAK